VKERVFWFVDLSRLYCIILMLSYSVWMGFHGNADADADADNQQQPRTTILVSPHPTQKQTMTRPDPYSTLISTLAPLSCAFV
jgi:hypothetical protein